LSEARFPGRGGAGSDEGGGMHRNGTANGTVGIRRDGLSPKQEAVCVLLAGGSSVEAAARKLSVSVTQIWEWKRTEPAFDARVRELRALVTSQAVGVLVEGMVEAARALRKLLKSESEPMRLKAADSLLNHGAQLSALSELQDRVAQLEGSRRR
jgi:transposase-like protein